MELKDTKHGKVIIMNFVDAEHCNLSFELLEFETETRSIDIKEQMPVALIIQFKGGFVATPEISEADRIIKEKSTSDFNRFIDELTIESTKKNEVAK